MTSQVHEILIVEGKKTSMAFCPPLPENHPEIILKGDDGEKNCIPIIYSTACWRNYIGTWEIADGKFSLVKLTGKYKLNSNNKILVDWFTGVLRIVDGELLHYVHKGFESVFERETHIKIKKGIVVNQLK